MKRMTALALFCLPLAVFAQPAAMKIGTIEFFGTSGIDTGKVRAQLPVREGDTVRESDFSALQSRIKSSVTQTVGHPPTDIAVVCCDEQKHLLLYVGLGGSNSHPLLLRPAPQGSACLSQPAVELYNRAMDANMKAVELGDASEDDSAGYALNHNPALRKEQLAMRDYALQHVAVVEEALEKCSVPDNRRAASEILGYADRSPQQIAALVRASSDSDSLVRNNAIRALGVLASAKGQGMSAISARMLIPLLNSDKWTDRNKGGLLFVRLTTSRDPDLLAALRQRAFASLVEMARWRESGHAGFYRMILGRIAGMDEARLEKLAQGGGVEVIIVAAEKKH